MLALLGTALVLQAQAPGDEPKIVTTLDDCEHGSLKTTSRQIAGYELFGVRECFANDAMMDLALHKGDAWWKATGTVVRYDGGHMSNAPLHTRMASHAIEPGTLADGKPAVVFHIELLHESKCEVANCGEADSRILQRFIMVCSLGDEPACATTRVQCTLEGCGDISLARGVLRFEEAGKPSVRRVE